MAVWTTGNYCYEPRGYGEIPNNNQRCFVHPCNTCCTIFTLTGNKALKANLLGTSQVKWREEFQQSTNNTECDL